MVAKRKTFVVIIIISKINIIYAHLLAGGMALAAQVAHLLNSFIQKYVAPNQL